MLSYPLSEKLNGKVTGWTSAIGLIVCLGVAGIGCSKAPTAAQAVKDESPQQKASQEKPSPAAQTPGNPDQDPPEVAIGERLFRETRFNQFFYAHSAGDANARLNAGDPAIEQLPTLARPFQNPYAGQGMNCASCHFVDEFQGVAGLGNRAYDDFARRSPIPSRRDRLGGPNTSVYETMRTQTLRNSPPFVNSTLALESGYEGHALFLHFDAEFTTPEDLVAGGFTGRNFGWLADEGPLAVAHLAHVIREDDGKGSLAQGYGGSYREVFLGEDPGLASQFRLPPSYRLDVSRASDSEILGAVSRLVGAYLRSLIYHRDPETGEFDGSPYDAFLKKNGLPRKPVAGESDAQYANRLKREIDKQSLGSLSWVQDGVDGKFGLSPRPFVFGAKEMQGLKIFAGRGNCMACHRPPSFTDFGFHNTGATQEEYDSIHGRGRFARIWIPSALQRRGREEVVFAPTAQHPRALGQFASIPSQDRPGYTDLGAWNVLGNPAMPKSQEPLRQVLCQKIGPEACTPEKALRLALGAFKTPNVRNLAQSAPYLHTGRKDDLTGVVAFYLEFSSLARQGRVRSVDPEIARIQLRSDDVAPLTAFLDALNEDYR